MAEDGTIVYDSRTAPPALGLTAADDLHLRAGLLHGITARMAARELTPDETEPPIGLDQASVSALTAGQISEFSTGVLIRSLLNSGNDVEIHILPCSGKRGIIRVLTWL